MKAVLRVVSMVVSFALLGGGLAAPAAAQQYPNKPIKLVIPFPPAGATDVLGRAVGQKLSESIGQHIVIENRPGAGSIIGADAVAKAAPDGYTLLLATGSLAIAANVYSKLPFDPAKSFTPVSLVAFIPHMLVVHPSMPVNSVKELVAYAKARPGQINAASQGNGTLSHLELELFKDAAGIDMVHVPYKGSGQVMPDLLAGNVTVFFDSVTSALPAVKKGQLKALGVVNAKRIAAAPELPTMTESGLAGFDVNNWFAVLAPAGTPKEVVKTLNAHLAKVLALPELREQMSVHGAVLESSTPEQMAAMIQGDLSRWAKVVKQAGIRLD